MRVALAVLALVVILNMLLVPWVAITPTDFLPDTVQQVLEVADMGLRRLAPAPVPGLLELLETVTILTPFRMLATGFLNPWMWVVILLPVLAAVITLLLAFLGWVFRSEFLFRWSSWAGACGGGLAAVLLIVSLPMIEHLGLGDIYLARLGLALAGLHLIWGYWITLVSVLGLTIVAAICLADAGRVPRKKASPTHGRTAPTYRR